MVSTNHHELFSIQELSELKKSLNVEVEQLRSVSDALAVSSFVYCNVSYSNRFFCNGLQEFQELRTTLQQQQEDVTVSLRNLGVPSLCMRFSEPNGTFCILTVSWFLLKLYLHGGDVRLFACKSMHWLIYLRICSCRKFRKMTRAVWSRVQLSKKKRMVWMPSMFQQ